MNTRIEELYRTIKQAKEKIEAIRKECRHEHTSEGLYEWWDMYITIAEICDDCGKALRDTGKPNPLYEMATFSKKEEP